MSDGVLYKGPANLAVMLSRGRQVKARTFRHPIDKTIVRDPYKSYYCLPIASATASTERKKVVPGELPALKRFVQGPVHTGPARKHPATQQLPHWIRDEIVRYVSAPDRSKYAYVVELVGTGATSINWELQRLAGRRDVRLSPIGTLITRPQAELLELAKQFQITSWCHKIHFVMRLKAFKSEATMKDWIATHPAHKHEPIAMDGTPRPDGSVSKPWFESMGYVGTLRLPLRDDAIAFAVKELSNWQLLRAYWKRGPTNPLLNMLNWPLEACSLHWDHCPGGTVRTRFQCDLKLEIYA